MPGFSRPTIGLTSAAAAVVLCGAPAHSQPKPQSPFPDQAYATEFLGWDVYGADMVRIGVIVDLGVDSSTRLVALVGPGRGTGRGGDPVMIPLSRLHAAQERRFTTDIPSGLLDGAGEIRGRAGDLLSGELRSDDGARVGTIKDLVVDPASKRMVAAVVELDGAALPGAEGAHVAVPLERVRRGGDGGAVADMSREQIRRAARVAYEMEEKD